VLETADRESIQLIVGIPVDRRVAGIQVPSPCISATLDRRPDVGVRAAIVERPISIAVAGQQTAVKNNHFIPFAFLERKVKVRFLAKRREDYWTGNGSLAFAVTKDNSGQL